MKGREPEWPILYPNEKCVDLSEIPRNILKNIFLLRRNA